MLPSLSVDGELGNIITTASSSEESSSSSSFNNISRTDFERSFRKGPLLQNNDCFTMLASVISALTRMKSAARAFS